MLSFGKYSDDKSWGTNNAIGFIGVLISIFLGFFPDAKLALGEKKEVFEGVVSLLPSIEALRGSFAPLHDLTDEFIKVFRERFEQDLIDVIIKQIEDAQVDFSNQEKNRKAAEAKLSVAEADKKRFEEQLSVANGIIKTLEL
jgi:DNA-binding SARP family transcriptional activator